jgi:hypothetical protein
VEGGRLESGYEGEPRGVGAGRQGGLREGRGFWRDQDLLHQARHGLGNPIGEKRVVDEITGTLVEKGWALAPEGQADAQVVLHGASQTKHSLHTYYSGMGGYRWGGMGTATTTDTQYVVGTLLVDIFDAKEKSLIWRGIAQDEASDKAEKNIKKVAKASDKLFKDFPPGSVVKK